MLCRSLIGVVILPVLIQAHMRVNITVTDKATPSIYTESTSDPIHDEEKKTFNLSDDNLKRIVREYLGEEPDDVFLCSPTPWNLYITYNMWPEVHRVITQANPSTVLKRSREVIPINKLDYNLTQLLKKTYRLKVSEIVQNTVTSKWKDADGIRAPNIKYDLALDFGSDIKWSRNAIWGVGFEEKRNRTIEKEITFASNPNQTIALELYASKNIINIKLFYTATLTGYVAVNYNMPYRGYHFWFIPIQDLMAKRLKTELKSTEEINIECYSDPQLIVRDYDTKSTLFTFPMNIK